MTVLGTAVDRHDEVFLKNRADMLVQLDDLDEQLQLAGRGGTERAVARHKATGKLTVRERVAMLIDPDTPFLEVGALAGYYTDYPVGGGAIVGIGSINGTECVIFGNDPTVLGGALTQTSIPKIDRALAIAKQNRMPYVSLIESAGGDLRPRGSDIEEILKSSTFHFAGTGGFFYETTVLSGLGIPTLAIVFGSSTAGGAYMPGLSEYTILVKEQAKVFLGGPPLVKVATGEESTDEELGGAEMHASVSGLADYLAEDELDAIRQARDVVQHLHWRKQGPGPVGPADPPVLETEDLLGLVSQDLRQPLDVREVIGRITDGSRFEEFKARYGTTLVCGWADIHGFPVGILGNNGPLFPDSSQKASQFIQLCNKTSTPLVFLQNITGYMVGKDYERAGMVKWGSQMINALSNSAVPHITVILGASYGAGNYGMGGRGFGSRFVFLWPTAKIAVMGPQQIAGVMSIVRRTQAARKGEEVDEALEKMITDAVAEVQERQSLAMYASGRGVDDGVIDPRDTRTVVGLCLSACHSAPVEGAQSFGGVPVIRRLLVANRGEIARRIIRTAHAMGIATVAVYADGDAMAPFVREAGVAVALRGSSAGETYLDAQKVLDAARRSGADAVHPGYGFLSENASFAKAVIDAGLIWVGPSPESIAAMGDKLEAKKLMAAAGVPTLDAPEGHFPVLVKAAMGGGGKGMRVVTRSSELDDAVAAAKREALAAFGDDTVFLERYLTGARHVEVQILGDSHGNLVHLGERECSIQRRHQKIIEEAPSPAVDAALRERLGEAALSAAKAIGYRNAGTVEFLLTGEEFFFLEVNTRLQVEHPVTELVTGLDLVRQQLLVAQGEPLSFTQADVTLTGHAVEARLYAEDPARDFLPVTGTVLTWEPAPGARYDSGIESGSVVGVEFDPMLAKVITHAPTRREAALALALALERTAVQGTTTNRDFLVATLRHEAFLAGDTTTDFIERVAPPRAREVYVAQLEHCAVLAALTAQSWRRTRSPLGGFPAGWRNGVLPPEAFTYRSSDVTIDLAYQVRRDGTFEVTVGENAWDARVLTVTPEGIEAEIDGVRHRVAVRNHGDRWWVGEVELQVLPRFPVKQNEAVEGGLVAPLPGGVIAVAVAPGDSVTAGQLLVVVEAMKMEHRITAPLDGTVAEVRATVGDQVAAGDLLVVLHD